MQLISKRTQVHNQSSNTFGWTEEGEGSVIYREVSGGGAHHVMSGRAAMREIERIAERQRVRESARAARALLPPQPRRRRLARRNSEGSSPGPHVCGTRCDGFCIKDPTVVTFG